MNQRLGRAGPAAEDGPPLPKVAVAALPQRPPATHGVKKA